MVGCGVSVGHYVTRAGVVLSIVNNAWSPPAFFCCAKPLGSCIKYRLTYWYDNGRHGSRLGISLLCTFTGGVQYIMRAPRGGVVRSAAAHCIIG